jgi:hypothetical protein
MHMDGKEEREAKTDPPAHTLYFLSGEACTLMF